MERGKRTVADSEEGGRVFALAVILAALWLGLAGVIVSRSIAASAQTLAHRSASSSTDSASQ